MAERLQILNEDSINSKPSFESKYTWYKTEDVFHKASMIGSGLINLKLVSLTEDNYKFCGFYAQNSLNYILCDIACILYGITVVPIYDTLGETATQFAFNQTKMTTCFVTSKHLPKIIAAKKTLNNFSYLKTIVILDP